MGCWNSCQEQTRLLFSFLLRSLLLSLSALLFCLASTEMWTDGDPPGNSFCFLSSSLCTSGNGAETKRDDQIGKIIRNEEKNGKNNVKNGQQ